MGKRTDLCSVCSEKCKTDCICCENAERCKKYKEQRERNDPEFKQNEMERQRNRRKNRTPEQIERDRETARERMRRHRALLQSTHCEEKRKVPAVETRKKKEEKRAKWKQYKQTYRNGLSSQKKRRIRENDRERKQLKAYQSRKGIGMPTAESPSEPSYTPAAASKAVYRAKNRLPRDPKKFACVVKGLIMSATPKKRKAIEAEIPMHTPRKKRRLEFCEKTMHCFKETFQKLKKSRKSKDTKSRKILATQLARIRKYRLLKFCSKEIGIRYNSLLKWSQLDPTDDCDYEFPRQKRADALSEEVVAEVIDFYLKPAVSITHSTKKTVLKKSMKQKQTMNYTLEAAHQKFKAEHQSNISFSKFASLKPKNVETVAKKQYRGCLCEQCTNVELYLKVINKKLDNKDVIKDKYIANQLTLCKSEKEGKSHTELQCVKRECDQCGVKLMRQSLHDIGKSDEQVQWFQWELVKIKNPKYQTEQSKKKLVAHVGTFIELIENFLGKLETFAYHLFVAQWQHKQFQIAKKGLEQGQVLCVLDFAENMTLRNQDECQSAHWGAHQVTVHPVVCYYLKDDESAEKKDEPVQLMTHEIVYISDDVTHDAHMVQKCVSQTIEILNDRKNTVTHMIQFTDGCSSQYKSKTPFADISLCENDHNIKIERHFFGTSHGKGPADGCSGVVKSAVSRAMKGDTVINTGAEMYDFCKEKLEKSTGTFRRTFVYIDPKEVNRSRPERTAAKPVKGTRQLHAVKALEPGTLAVRNLSCCCSFCLSGKGECPSTAMVGEWKVETVLKVLQTKKRSTKIGKEEHKNTPQKFQKSTIVEEKREDDIPASEINVDGHTEHETENAKKEMELSLNPDVSRDQYFAGKLKELNMCESFEILYEKCLALKPDFESLYPIQYHENINIMDCKLSADKVACDLLPGNFKEQHPTQLPVNVVGDGNCLPRCGSILAFGHELAHEEIRARIIVEMVCNQSCFTDNAYLNEGIELPNNEKENLCNTYTMFSEYYLNEVITSQTVQRIYQQEAMNITKLGSYMGIWQLFALSTVLKCKIRSVYPSLGAAVPRLLLNRSILPAWKDTTAEVKIMWSSTRQDMSEKYWNPNHFVPILSMVPVAETVYFDFSTDSSFLLSDIVESEDIILSALFDTSQDQVSTEEDTDKHVDPDESHLFREEPDSFESVSRYRVLPRSISCSDETPTHSTSHGMSEVVDETATHSTSHSMSEVGDDTATHSTSHSVSEVVDDTATHSTSHSMSEVVDDTATHSTSHGMSEVVDETATHSTSHSMSQVGDDTAIHSTSHSMSEVVDDTATHSTSHSMSEVVDDSATHSTSHSMSEVGDDPAIHSTSHSMSEVGDDTAIHSTSHSMSEVVDDTATNSTSHGMSEVVDDAPTHSTSHGMSEVVDETATHSTSHSMSEVVDDTATHSTSHGMSEVVDDTPTHSTSHGMSEVVDDTATHSTSHGMSEVGDDTAIHSTSHSMSEVGDDTAIHSTSHSMSEVVDDTATHSTSHGMSEVVDDAPTHSTSHDMSEVVDETPTHSAGEEIFTMTPSLRYKIGSYVAINNGKQVLPAVVTSFAPLAVRYFQKKRSCFTPDDEPYEIDSFDIMAVLPEPIISLVGTRLYYKFEKF